MVVSCLTAADEDEESHSSNDTARRRRRGEAAGRSAKQSFALRDEGAPSPAVARNHAFSRWDVASNV